MLPIWKFERVVMRRRPLFVDLAEVFAVKDFCAIPIDLYSNIQIAICAVSLDRTSYVLWIGR